MSWFMQKYIISHAAICPDECNNIPCGSVTAAVPFLIPMEVGLPGPFGSISSLSLQFYFPAAVFLAVLAEIVFLVSANSCCSQLYGLENYFTNNLVNTRRESWCLPYAVLLCASVKRFSVSRMRDFPWTCYLFLWSNMWLQIKLYHEGIYGHYHIWSAKIITKVVILCYKA